MTVGGTRYTSTTSSKAVSGLQGTVFYTFDYNVAGSTGTRYICSTGYSGSVSSSTTKSATYSTQYYLTIQAGVGGTVTPSSQWYDTGTAVQIEAFQDPGYAFLQWVGVGTIEYTGTDNPSNVTMNSPVTETAIFQSSQLIVESGIDALNENLDGVSITVDGTTKTTSGGSASFDISMGSHSVTAPATVSNRPFSHFWDHDSNVDCTQNDPKDTSSNPYTFSVADCGRTITALYKAFTHFKNSSGTLNSIDFNGTAISGFLLKEDGNPLNYNVPVTVSYFDGSWHTLGTATALSTNGYFAYPWSCVGSATIVKAVYTPGDWIFVGSEGTKSISGTETVSNDNCNDGVDNDCDGLSDEDDPGCMFCGDGICNGDEIFDTCSGDCTYSATFQISGISEETTWGVTVGGTRRTSDTTSLIISGLHDSNAYDFDDTLVGRGSGRTYECSSGCSGSVSEASTVSATYTIPSKNTMTFSGTLRYSDGEPVANSKVMATITNNTVEVAANLIGYNRNVYNTTDADGYFSIRFVNVPESLTRSDFDLSIYVVGEIEAIYECHYDSGTRRCT
ncbi:MAG: hypothetical protein NWF05_05400 [Candidatus Bathyarchaeota archaeon]|nr:hypothetical protein [Candidatus Bathyarchaeota archaeon]